MRALITWPSRGYATARMVGSPASRAWCRSARQLYDAIAVAGDLALARRLWAKLAPLMRLQFSAYHARGDGAHWFSVMKATLNLIGPPVGDPAPPVLPLEPEWKKQLLPLLRDLGYQPRGDDL